MLLSRRALAVACSCVLISAILATGAADAAAGLETFEVAPLATDSTVTAFKSPHVVARNSSVTSRGLLNVVLPGTDIEPGKMKEFVKAGADAGFPSIGLRFANNWGTGRLCGSEADRRCYEKVRYEAFDGVDRTPKINVPPRDSVTGRLAALLVYLDRQRPAEEWSRFLESPTQPKWSSIIVSGHSTGAGEAAFIALRKRLAGVALLSGPGDGSANNLAPWIQPPNQNATPLADWYALSHAEEKSVADHKAAWAKIGVPGPIVAVDGKDAKMPPYGGAQKLLTTAPPPDGNHHRSVAIDRSLVLVGGKPALVPAWTHLLSQGGAGGGDTTRPTVSLTSPANGSEISGRFDVAATATDAAGITNVEFLVDGMTKVNDTSAPYNATIDSTQLTNGSHSLAAKAYDPSGNTAESVVTVTVRNSVSSNSPFLVANSSGDTGSASASSLSVDHAVPATGIDRYLVVGIGWKAASPPTLSAVSYQRVAMSQLGSTVSPDQTVRVALFGLANPAVGTGKVAVTLSGVAGVVVSARTFSGVDPGSLAVASAKGKSATISVSPPTGQLVVDWAVNFGNSATAVPGAGQVEDANRATTPSGFDLRGLASHRSGATGTSALSWALSSSKAWGTLALALASS